MPVEASGQASATQSTVRQIGSALGTAFAGTALSVTLAINLPAALKAGGVTGPQADQIAAQTRQSAGTTIMQLRMQGAGGPMGKDTPAVIDASRFATSTRWALLVATVFLILGFVGASQLHRAAKDVPLVNPATTAQ